MIKRIRPYLSVTLLVLVLAYASYYIYKHKQLFKPLAHTNASTLLSVYGLNIVMLCVLVSIFSATLFLCDMKLKARENFKLNIHSLLINFFIPGQGGPAYRGAYLFKIHKLKIKKYILATLIYYTVYAVLSILFLLIYKVTLWESLIAAVLIAVFCYVVIDRYTKRSKLEKKTLNITPKSIGFICVATLSQLILQASIYGIELHSVNSHIHFDQVITYTGAANLALFVGLTPGAIGVRETFLIVSKKLHHISTANIISANIIDRGVFLVFLLTLALLIGLYHIKMRFYKKQLAGVI